MFRVRCLDVLRVHGALEDDTKWIFWRGGCGYIGTFLVMGWRFIRIIRIVVI